MGLDKYGFPATAIANSILTGQEAFGDSDKKLEESWLEWLHYNPFDYQVAQRLAALMEERLSRLDPRQDEARRQVLARKLALVSQRADRYRITNLTQ